jgi:uncharacterized protein YuzB (UPF0349 family)
MSEPSHNASTAVIPPPPAASQEFGDVQLIRLAREIAMDIRTIDQILDVLELDHATYEGICAMPQFQRYLRVALEEWNSALNTAERVKIKSLSFVEESLPEFYARAHDPKEGLAPKVELLKTIARFAGVGGQVTSGTAPERMVVTINLGSDHQLRVERDITTTYEEVEDRL